MRTFLPLAAALAAGCIDSKIQSDFNVQLEPRAPVGQAPVAGASELGLVLLGSGDPRVLPLDATAIDSEDPAGVEALGLQPLNNALVGLVGAPSIAELQASTVFSYGQVGPFTLSKDDEPITARVLVAQTGRVGQLGALTGERTARGAAAALGAAGDAFLFGGETPSGASSDAIARLTDLDDGTWAFDPVGVMPGGARIGGTATVVDLNGEEAILVTGGRTDSADPGTNTDSAFLLSTSDALVSWTGNSRDPRSGHRAVPLINGRVLLIGGYVGGEAAAAESEASFEVFDPGFQVFNSGSQPAPVPSLGFGLANVGSEGVFVCGGHTWEGDDANDLVVHDTCAWISPLGAVTEAPPLPVALTGLAMAAIDERHVVATGGLTGVLGQDGTMQATNRVFLYTLASDSWQELDPMVYGRAHHRAAVGPDERVVFIGGVQTASPDAELLGTAVECTEVYDPITRAIDEGGCSAIGAGAQPLVADHDLHGALVFTANDDNDNAGTSYGIVPYPPAL